MESKGEGKANEGSGGESQTAGKRRKKNTGMSSETINTCMLERERERESGLFSAHGCHGNRGLATDADVRCSQMLGT